MKTCHLNTCELVASVSVKQLILTSTVTQVKVKRFNLIMFEVHVKTVSSSFKM